MVTGEAMGVTAIIIGFFILFLIIKKSIKKSKKKQEKGWIVLEHSEEQDGRTNKCYFVENKKSKIKSPCFKEKQKLNKWLRQNAEQTA